MHISSANYRRGIAYPALGFDRMFLGDKFFNYHSFYGNREWTDMDNYRDLEDAYMDKYGEQQFIFLVTYQNHGGYEINPPEYYMVHTTKDFENLTDDIDEYLTSISLSGDAFVYLTDFFPKLKDM